MRAREIIEALERKALLVIPVLFAALFVAVPAAAQSPLSLSEAIARAKARNPDAGSAAAAEREAADRVTQVHDPLGRVPLLHARARAARRGGGSTSSSMRTFVRCWYNSVCLAHSF
jgi:hypothetical protein